MKKELCAFNDSWDYLGWSNVKLTNEYSAGYSQNYWNQTLFIKINRISTKIYQSSHLGYANIVEINNKLKPLFETLLFFRSDEYNIIYNNEIDENVIYIYKLNNHLGFIPFFNPDDVSFIMKPLESFEQKYIDEYKKKLCGYIQIENYK